MKTIKKIGSSRTIVNKTLSIFGLFFRKGREREMAFLTAAARDELESIKKGWAFLDASRSVGAERGG